MLDDASEFLSFVRRPSAFALLVFIPDCKCLAVIKYHKIRFVTFFYLSSVQVVDPGCIF